MSLYNPSNNWQLSDWLYYLENKEPRTIRLGVSRILEVAKKLNLDIPESKVITVAGTNGKGSTVSALETIYHEAGYRVGSYTSPHLIRFNERIKVNLLPVTDEQLCALFQIIEKEREQIELSYFEMATLAALLHFKQVHLDIIILEVGLGGRLDATNIIDADVAVITTIDYDHQDYLGTTLEAIGYEKAGILRQKKPFIFADINPPASVLRIAKELNTVTFLYNSEFSIDEHEEYWDLYYPMGCIKGLIKPKIQLKSAAAAITACSLLTEYLPISAETVNQALKKIFIPGRLQCLPAAKTGVQVLYDVSHNPQSVQLLADTIKYNVKKEKVHAVFSALKDKDIAGLIRPLKNCVDYWYPAQLDNIRAASADYLLSICKKEGILAEICYTTPLIAFEQAMFNAESGDLVVVFGSFFTVGHVMAAQH